MGIAREIKKRLEASGHTVDLQSVVAKSKKPWKEQMPTLQVTPNPRGYDCLVLGAPAWGFTLSHVMREYLYQVRPIETEKLVLFSTCALPRFFGGNRAMKVMASIARTPESGTVFAGSVRFPRSKKPRHIDEVVDQAVEAVESLV